MRDTVSVDIEKALRHAKRSMPGKQFHNAGHVKRVHKVAKRLSGSGYDEDVVRVAAAFHDVGHSISAQGHEVVSADKAEEYLREHGINNDQYINDVKQAILSTKMNQRGAFHTDIKNDYGKILADADVHNFGLPWEEFLSRNEKVRREVGEPKDKSWYEHTLSLLESHKWHASGGQIYQNKQDNIQRLQERIEGFE